MDALMRIGFGLFGLAVLLGIAWLFSSNKRAVDWKLVGTGVALQIVFAAFVLMTPWGSKIFEGLGAVFVKLIGFTNEGSKMILGGLADQDKYGFVFIFHALPTVIFFASFMAVLYHLGVMQWVVKVMAMAITKVMKVSGAETTSVCASVFIGQTEAPLTVRPYIGRMTESELLTMMIGGMAHIATSFAELGARYADLIITEVDRFGGPIDKVRAGYLLELLAGVTDPRIDAWTALVSRGGSRVLDPGAPYAPEFSRRWSLSINLPGLPT